MTTNPISNNIKQSKRLKAMVHILLTPDGVSEKSINSVAHSMSGRNVPTDLERKHNIGLKKPRTRLRAIDGSFYSIYELQDMEQVHKLVKLILYYCSLHNLPTVEQTLINKALINFECYFKNNSAKEY
jgi:hypothetical protein